MRLIKSDKMNKNMLINFMQQVVVIHIFTPGFYVIYQG